MSHPLGEGLGNRDDVGVTSSVSGAFLDETQFYDPKASSLSSQSSSMPSFNESFPRPDTSRTATLSRPAPAPIPTNSNGSSAPSSRSSKDTNPANAYLEISVTDPVKQGDSIKAYVTYKVSTKTNLPLYQRSDTTVIRRFSDFEAIHDRLLHENKGIIIPPLPEKNVVEKYRLSSEFIEARRRALETFLARVAAHPRLRVSTHLQKFLEASEDDWARHAKQADNPTLFSKKGTGDFLQIFKDMQTSLSAVVLGKEKSEEETDPKYQVLRKQFAEYEAQLAHAQKQALRLVKRYKEHGQALFAFGESMVHLGQGEGGPLGRALCDLGNRSDSLSTRSAKHGVDLLMSFEQPLKEYVRMMQSIKTVLDDRLQAQQQQLAAVADWEARRSKLASLRASQPLPKAEKIAQAEVEIAEAQRRSEVAQEELELLIRNLDSELECFQEQKTKDLGKVMQEYAATQACMARDTAQLWRALLPAVQAAKPPSQE